MTAELDRAGTFRGRIIEYGLQEGKAPSQSVGITIKVQIDEAYNFDTAAWEDWRGYEPVACYGYVNIVDKLGKPNDRAIENMCLCTAWNGNLGDVAMGEWKPEPIQFTTKANEYNGTTSFKVDYVNPYDRAPGGGIKSVSIEKAKELQAKYGTSFRALAASAKRSMPPADKPVPPPPAAVITEELPF